MAHVDLPFLPAAWDAGRDHAPALYDNGAWISYGVLREQVAALLPALAAPRKELIFCAIEASAAGVAAYLAAAASGHAVAMLDVGVPQWAELVAAYQPAFIIAPAAHPHDLNYRVVAWADGAGLWAREEAVHAPIHPDLFLLLLTSGSTGGKKFVRLSYRNLASNTAAIIDSLGLRATARAFLHLPLSYSFGLSVLHTQLAVGGGVVVTGLGMMERGFWDLARHAGATLFPGVPYHYEMLARLGLARLNLPELTIFLQAGGRLDPALVHQLLPVITARQGALFVMYGQTEAAPRISCFAAHEHADKIGSVGRVLPGGTVTLEADEITYRGANVMLGYATTRTDLALGDTQNGVLRTGDLGAVDADGFITITGRKQRFAKLFGMRIALDEIEQLLRPLAPVAVYETAAKIVIMTTADAPTQELLRQTVATQTSLQPNWVAIRGIAEFPYLANGKLDYRALMESKPPAPKL
jgi:acyl-CoA synthetase (AMP-forming)/AMP-acid ligase II